MGERAGTSRHVNSLADGQTYTRSDRQKKKHAEREAKGRTKQNPFLLFLLLLFVVVCVYDFFSGGGVGGGG